MGGTVHGHPNVSRVLENCGRRHKREWHKHMWQERVKISYNDNEDPLVHMPYTHTLFVYRHAQRQRHTKVG
jgi:hypothetical protein